MIGWSDAESKTRDDTERDPQDARLSSRRFWILSNPLCLLEFTGAMHDRDRTSLATAARSADRSRADRGAAPGNRPCRVHNPRNAEAPVTTKVSRSPSCRSHIGGRDVAVCASTATRGGWLCLSHNIRILATSTPGVARRLRGAGRSASLNPRAFHRCRHSCLWRRGYASTMAASFRCDRPAMTGPKANRQCARTCGGGAR